MQPSGRLGSNGSRSSATPRADPSYARSMPGPTDDDHPAGRRAIRQGRVRAALEQWWPLLAANLVWTGVALVLAMAAMATPPAIVFLPLLAVPTAGVFRVAGRIIRETGSVTLEDALDAWRADVRRTVAVGAAFAVAWIILALNLAIGTGLASVLGWAIAIMSAWVLVGSWLLFWTLWPILTDPGRTQQPVRRQLRLAALLVLADPLRIGLVALANGVLLVVSAITIVPLVTVAIAVSALIAGHVVLPAADQLEARLGSSAAS